jgi:integrase
MALSGKLTVKLINQTNGPTTLNDGNGLYLKIRASGSRSWFCRIRHPETKKLTDKGMGSYADVSLVDARRLLPQVRQEIIQDSEWQTRIPTFAEYSSLFIQRKAPEWRHAKHKQKWTNTLKNHAYPVIGALLISDIETHHLVKLLNPIWTTKTETAMKLRQRIEAIIDSATVEGLYTSANPARWRGHLSHLLPNPHKFKKVTHYPAMPYQDVPAFVADLRQREALSARLLEFVILTACRQSEARLATHDEIDRANRIWTIPASRMKTNREHRVPLTDRMLEIIDGYETDSFYVFAEQGRPLSTSALRMLMIRMGVGDFTPHGFRSSFRDWCSTNSGLGFEVFERALAHKHGSTTVNAYARSDLLEQRRVLMQEWKDFVGSGY